MTVAEVEREGTEEAEGEDVTGLIRDLPHRYEAELPLDQMYVDRYQRPLSGPWVSARTDRFNPALFGVVIVSERPRRNKLYSVIDGQQRSALAGKVGLLDVPALVYYGLTIEQESDLFVAIQRERRAVTPLERFNAALVAKDPTAMGVQRLVAEYGFVITYDTVPGAVKSIVAMERIYKADAELLRRVLRLISETWGKLPGAASESMIGAIRDVLVKIPEMNEERFTEQLEQLTPTSIAQKASQLRDIRGHEGSLRIFMAEIIETQYGSTRRRRAA